MAYRYLALNAAIVFILVGIAGWRLTIHRPTTAAATLGSLKGVEIPLPDELDRYVVNRQAAVQLGKAFFWDMQAGSDGIQACASCHFNAGADSRKQNQLSPSGAGMTDQTFSFGGPNVTVTARHFPFGRETNEVMSSQGVFLSSFKGTRQGQAEDVFDYVDDAVFHVGNVETRRVEPRNTPTTINAVFNFRNFWDGRANNVFNGVDPFGLRNPDACIWVDRSGSLVCEPVALEDASLASQAVGPPLSDFEMSAAGRTLPHLGRKMLGLRPLARQKVDAHDSVLGSLARPDKGLNTSYKELIYRAFADDLWGDATTPDGFTQTEANFSLFWGLSLLLYQATLVSDDTPLDRYFEGEASALTPRQQLGMAVFMSKGRCVNCHGGPELTNAASHLRGQNPPNGLVERMLMGDGGVALYDNAFYNIGVRPTAEDVGVGGRDPWNNPLSFTRQFLDRLKGTPAPDPFVVDPCTFDAPADPNDCSVLPDPHTARAAVDGAFKTPGLRNVALTGPYFHNGGQATLMQVVEFYDRGGDFRQENRDDLDPDITPLGLTQAEKEALVDFLLALTDERVRHRKAPFDHPQLFIPDGHPGDHSYVVDNGRGQAVTTLREIPAVGAGGGSPLLSFTEELGLSHFDPTYTTAYADLSLTKSVDNPAPNVGDEITFTLVVKNDGPARASRVDVRDDLPDGLAYVSATGVGSYNPGTGIWAAGSIDPGKQLTLRLRVKVTKKGTFKNVAEVVRSDQPDPDSTPYNGQREDDLAYASVTSTHTSGGGNAGVESDGSLATLLARRLFERRQDALLQRALRAAPEPVLLSEASLPAFASAGKATTARTTTNLTSYIPQHGPQQSTAYVVTPADLLGLTNATSVFAADYLRPEGRRLAALFGATSPAGVLYDHAKATCDRLAGGRLEEVGLLDVDGHPFALSELVHPGGEVDFAVSFVAYRTGNAFTIDSRFAQGAYSVPPGSDEVLNFQVWSVAPAYTAELVRAILERMATTGPVSYLNRAEQAPAVPEVFVREGAYEHGRLTLELVNRAGASTVTVRGTLARTETEAARQERTPFEETVSLPKAAAGGETVTVTIDVGPVFDATFEVEHAATQSLDQLYYADGAWSYQQGPQSHTRTFETYPESRADVPDAAYTLERGVYLSGTLGDWASLFRYLRPGGQAVDLSRYRYVEFTAWGQGQLELALEKASIDTPDPYVYRLRLEPEKQTYRIYFDELRRNGSDVADFTAEDVTLLVFYVTGSGPGGRFDLAVEDVAFGGATSVALEATPEVPSAYTLAQNYPNPFNPATTITFGLPEAADVQLDVFDVMGRHVRTLARGMQPAGTHTVTFEGSGLASGVYVYRLVTAGRVLTRQMVLMK